MANFKTNSQLSRFFNVESFSKRKLNKWLSSLIFFLFCLKNKRTKTFLSKATEDGARATLLWSSEIIIIDFDCFHECFFLCASTQQAMQRKVLPFGSTTCLWTLLLDPCLFSQRGRYLVAGLSNITVSRFLPREKFHACSVLRAHVWSFHPHIWQFARLFRKVKFRTSFRLLAE